MKSPNARLPACRLKQQLCVNHEQLLGAVGDLTCKERLFVGIYSNNASAWLKFKNACRCVSVHVYHASALKKRLLRVPHHLQPDHRLKSPPLLPQQEIAAFML